jgi:hypothetical protein
MNVGSRYTTPTGRIAEVTNVLPDRIELVYVTAAGKPISPVKENLLVMTVENMRFLKQVTK